MSAPDLIALAARDSLAELDQETRASAAVHPLADLPGGEGKVLRVMENAADLQLTFARQILPAARVLAADSLHAFARTLADEIIQNCKGDAPWRLHVSAGVPGQAARRVVAERVRKLALEVVAARRKRLLAARIVDDSPFAKDETLFQMHLAADSSAYLATTPRPQTFAALSPFSGGLPEIPEDRAPPSRAYRKLIEAQAQFGENIRAGQHCVDLGASPGGWSYVALAAGAAVIAVDRSPLRDDLMSHTALRYVRGDAFAYEPDRPVDWLLSDVIAFPERILELLDRWTRAKLCKRLCVTIKFRGQSDYPILADFKQLLSTRTKRYRLRRLSENKNEATAFAWL